MREGDELGEADDEFAKYTSARERIVLGKKSRKAEAKKRREEMESLIAETVEDDEEERTKFIERDTVITPPSATWQTPAPQVCRPSPVLATIPTPTLEPAVARLSQTLSNLAISHSNNVSAMNSTADELAQVEEKVEVLRQRTERTTGRFVGKGKARDIAIYEETKYGRYPQSTSVVGRYPQSESVVRR